MKRVLWFSLCALFSYVCAASGQEGPKVESFSPQGTVKNIRQVRVRFTHAMVAFGDPRSITTPFEVNCPVKGEGRWVDTNNWVYDFEKNLLAGVRCDFRLRPDLKTLAGVKLRGRKDFSFSTGGPAIKASYPHEGNKQIDEEQVFILTLDGEPDEESVLRHVAFSIQGIENLVGVRMIQGEEREQILKERYRWMKRPDAPLILLQCKQRFPAETPVRLIWGKGVMSGTLIPTESDQILPFATRPKFAAVFQCEKENPKADCSPLSSMHVRFSAPVSRDQAAAVSLRSSDGKTWKPQEEDQDVVYGVSFKSPFPEQTAFTLELPAGLKDDADRSLANADKFPLSIRTDRYPPLAKFPARFGIVELKGDRLLPVTLRNVEPEVKAKSLKLGQEQGTMARIIARIRNIPHERPANLQTALKRVASASRERSMLEGDQNIKELKVPKPSGSKAFEVVGIPFKDPGFYLVELESTLLGQALLGAPKPMYVPTSVLITNLSVHFKWGRESSLVWVTTLDKAEPVRDVTVTVLDCKEAVLWSGKTDGDGIAMIKDKLPSMSNLPDCRYQPDSLDAPQMGALSELQQGLFVVAQTPSDMAFVHSSWDKGIEPFRFKLPNDSYPEGVMAHTIFDRTLFRSGETVHMKHILRRHTMNGFSPAPSAQEPNTVSITHLGSFQTYEFPLKWDALGVAETEWAIPREAKLGTYGVSLLRKEASGGQGLPAMAREEEVESYGDQMPGALSSGTFRVEEFRVPLMKAVIKPPAEPLINPEQVPLDLGIQYLSGGGAGGLAVKLRSEVRPRVLPAFEGFDAFVFANGRVKEGIQERGREWEEEEGAEQVGRGGGLKSTEIVLDPSGSSRVLIPDLPKIDAPKELFAEMEYHDPNGEIQTASSRIPLWNSRLLIGIRPDSWAASQEAFKFHVAALDIAGRPVSGASVKVDLLQKKYYSHRKRIVGGFYSYEHVEEVKRVGTLFEGKTDSRGLLIAEVRSPVSGNVILQAESTDGAGNRTSAYREVWIAEKGRWWFDISNHDRMDLIPEKKRYEPGETAVFQARMPFKEATALITVEREGVMESWVRKLTGEKPVIEVPVKGAYAPNVFVSVLVVRGRVADVPPTALVDLGKPAYKLGIAEIKVGWKEHELKVNVSPDRPVYKVREKAQVKIRVRTVDDAPPPKGSEVALAAVDEGLLELMPNKSWDILSAMMGRRGYEVQTATAQMQVIGKRHYGLKALPSGGGGGRQITRELFDTLLLWKGRVALDAHGEASVEIPLNDSITGFRIAAVVTGGQGLFGTGSASIQSTQDLMIFSGLPPLVREGDRFRAEFTIRNTTQQSMDVEASARADGVSDSLPLSVVPLAAGEAKTIGWDTRVPVGISAIHWEVEVGEKGSATKDHIKVSQRVIAAVPSRTFQATIAQVKKPVRLEIERPQDALPERGGVKVSFRPKIAQSLTGVTEYMKSYPYGCMEQKISVAISLRDETLWKRLMAQLPSHMDAEGLVKYFPSMTLGSPVLTSYLVAIAQEAGWEIPEGLREKMETGLRGFVQGSINRGSPLPTADLSIRKLTAMEALSRVEKMEPRLLSSIAVEPNLWPTSALIDWINILLREERIPNRETRLKEAEQILRSRLNLQGTTMSFSTERTDALWWLMISNDVNSVRTVLTLLSLKSWEEDMARVVRGALSRQKRGRWDLTLANAWGVLAVEKFCKAFEAEPVSGISTGRLSGQDRSMNWETSSKGGEFLFPWPEKREALILSHEGTGKPWVTVQSLAAIPLKEPFSSGYKIEKELIPLEKKNPVGWSRGDLVRVRLDLEAQSDQTWVVVSDPIPAGATILGTGLGRDSQLLTQGEERKGDVWPAYEERSFEAFRAYYEYVPIGKWRVEYTLRLNQSGAFQLSPTRVEALYFPEMMGEIPNEPFEVQP
jgi:uncharacterized protein YfaS (alpha-2-macroglobulin family)